MLNSSIKLPLREENGGGVKGWNSSGGFCMFTFFCFFNCGKIPQWIFKQRHDLIRCGFYQRVNWAPQVILEGRFRDCQPG